MTNTEFEKIFKEQFPVLCNLAASVVKDSDEAKDVVQQVFLKLWQKKDELVIRGPVAAYLYRAVINTAYNHNQRSQKIVGLDSRPELRELYENEPACSQGQNVEVEVKKAIDSLSPVCREVFTMSRFTDLSNREIAQEFNISVKAVEKHISKAFKVLREKLKPIMASEMVLLFCFLEVGFLSFSLSIFTIILN